MRIFVTGASGWIGSALVPELIDAGHHVVGLARSDASARALMGAGAEPHQGSLGDLESLRAGAKGADGVVHLAFIHDFAAHEDAVGVDLLAIETLVSTLEGSGHPLLIASGIAAKAAGPVTTERDPADPNFPRAAAAEMTLAAAQRGIRTGVVRLPPSVHGRGDRGFVPTLIEIARQRGVSAYIGEGANRWPAVHRLDAARLFRLALDKAPPGAVLHPVGDEGVSTRAIAEVIGRHLDVPVTSVALEDAASHFGWIGRFFGGIDAVASSALTRELLHWEPTQPGLMDDLEQGHYFEQPMSATARSKLARARGR